MVGDLRALGMASSSKVLPRERVGVGAGDRVRLRMAIPWRCRSLRFCAARVSESERPAMAAVLFEDAHKAATRAARAVAGQPLAGPLLL